MSALNTLRTTLVDPLLNFRLWLLQFLGNALLIAVFAWFLHIGDGYGWQITLSAILALLMIAGVLLVHGGTMNHALDSARARSAAGGPPAEVMTAVKRAASHLLPLLLWAVVFYLLESFIDRLEDFQYSFPGWLRSEFSAWLRKMISEPAIDHAYMVCVSYMRWILVPAFLLPLGTLCADLGFRGMAALGAWRRTGRKLRLWVVLLLMTFLSVHLIRGLMGWTLNPQTASLGAEKLWLAVRLLIAYIVAIAAWLIVCAALAATRQRADEDSSGSSSAPAPAPAPVTLNVET